jgi:hypothetical protein
VSLILDRRGIVSQEPQATGTSRKRHWPRRRRNAIETGRIVQLTDVPGGIEGRGQAHGVCPHRSDPRRVFYIGQTTGEVFVVDVETAVSRRRSNTAVASRTAFRFALDQTNSLPAKCRGLISAFRLRVKCLRTNYSPL